jgi:hypothetical protein
MCVVLGLFAKAVEALSKYDIAEPSSINASIVFWDRV